MKTESMTMGKTMNKNFEDAWKTARQQFLAEKLQKTSLDDDNKLFYPFPMWVV